MEIKNLDNYDKLNHRNGNVFAWLDELLEDVSIKVCEAINAKEVDGKDAILCSIVSFLNGVQDGNRFAKPNPYTPENPALPGIGSRIIVQVPSSRRAQ